MLSGQGGFPVATDVLGKNFGCMGAYQEWTNLLFFNRSTNVGTIFAFSVYSDGVQDTIAWKPVETIRPQALVPISTAHPMLERSVVVGPIVPTRPWGLVATGNFWMVDQNDEYFGTNGKYPQYHLLYNGGCIGLLFYDSQSGTIQFYPKETAQITPLEPLCGYASARSVLPGETIQFHISSQVGAYRIDVYRQATDLVYMGNVPANLGPPRAYGISRRAFEDGAEWPAAASLTVPSTWFSGLYLARVQAGQLLAPGAAAVEAQAVSPRAEAPLQTQAPSGAGALARRFAVPTGGHLHLRHTVRRSPGVAGVTGPNSRRRRRHDLRGVRLLGWPRPLRARLQRPRRGRESGRGRSYLAGALRVATAQSPGSIVSEAVRHGRLAPG